MKKSYQIICLILYLFSLQVFSISAQNVPTETKKIDANGLKKLLPNAENKQPVLLNFWATWCPPCRSEFPDLVKINADYRAKGLVFNVVSVDNPVLIDSAIPQFLQEFNSPMPSYLLDFPNRRESAKAIRQIAPKVRDIYPLTLLFDKNGRLVFQKIGKINAKMLRSEIDKVIRK